MNLPVLSRVQPRLVWVFLLCIVAGAAVPALALRQSTEPRTIEVVVKRYAFEPAEIQVAVGERVRLLVRSADGPHGVEIKRFRVSKEIPRGTQPVAIDVTADEAGSFPILCSVFCGEGHESMKGTLVVTAGGSQP